MVIEYKDKTNTAPTEYCAQCYMPLSDDKVHTGVGVMHPECSESFIVPCRCPQWCVKHKTA